MPFKSKQQSKFAFATKQPWAKEWADKTDFASLPAIAPKKAAMGNLLPGVPPPAKQAFNPDQTIGPGQASGGSPIGGVTHFGNLVAPNSKGKPSLFREAGLQSGGSQRGQQQQGLMGGGPINTKATPASGGTPAPSFFQQREDNKTANTPLTDTDDPNDPRFGNTLTDTDDPDDSRFQIAAKGRVLTGSSANLSPIAPKAPAWQINDRPDGQPEAVKDPASGQWKVFNGGKKTVVTNNTNKVAPVALASALPSIAPMAGLPQPPVAQATATDSGTMSLSQKNGLSETPDAAPDGSAAGTGTNSKPKVTTIPGRKNTFHAGGGTQIPHPNSAAASAVAPLPPVSNSLPNKRQISQAMLGASRLSPTASKSTAIMNDAKARGVIGTDGRFTRPYLGYRKGDNVLQAADELARDPSSAAWAPGEYDARSAMANGQAPPAGGWHPGTSSTLGQGGLGSGPFFGPTQQAPGSHSWEHPETMATIWKTPAERAGIQVNPEVAAGKSVSSDEINPTLAATQYGSDANGNRVLKSDWGGGSSNLKTSLPPIAPQQPSDADIQKAQTEALDAEGPEQGDAPKPTAPQPMPAPQKEMVAVQNQNGSGSTLQQPESAVAAPETFLDLYDKYYNNPVKQTLQGIVNLANTGDTQVSREDLQRSHVPEKPDEHQAVLHAGDPDPKPQTWDGPPPGYAAKRDAYPVDEDDSGNFEAAKGRTLPGMISVPAHQRRAPTPKAKANLPSIAPMMSDNDGDELMPQAAKGRKLAGHHHIDAHSDALKKMMEAAPHLIAAHKAIMGDTAPSPVPMPPAPAPMPQAPMATPPASTTPVAPMATPPASTTPVAPIAPPTPAPQQMAKGGSLWGNITPPVVPAKMAKGGVMDRANTTSTMEKGLVKGPGELAVRPKTGDMQILTKANAIVKNPHKDPVTIYPSRPDGKVMPVGYPSIAPKR